MEADGGSEERLVRALTAWDMTGSLDAFADELNSSRTLTRQWRQTIAAILSGELVRKEPKKLTTAARNQIIREAYQQELGFWKGYQKYAKRLKLRHGITAYGVTPAEYLMHDLARRHGLKIDSVRLILRGHRKKG